MSPPFNSQPRSRRTRGKSCPGRLSRLDSWTCHHAEALLRRSDGRWAKAVVVDLGIGARPWTTIETARAYRQLKPDLELIGVDNDPLRVTNAQAHAIPGVSFREGGFALPLAPTEPARLIRAMNVLRQYRRDDVAAAHHAMSRHLLEGGLLIAGSSNRQGETLVALLLRGVPGGLQREGLLFATDFSKGFAPRMFRRTLPRDLRAGAHPIGPIQDFLSLWHAAWRSARTSRNTGQTEVFIESAQRLAERVSGVDTDPWSLSNGILVWRTPGGVPDPSGSGN